MFKIQIRHRCGGRADRFRDTLLLLAIGTFITWLPDRPLAAGEITGKVAAVTGKTATITTDEQAGVKVGDRVEIFEILAEIQEEASVATGAFPDSPERPCGQRSIEPPRR